MCCPRDIGQPQNLISSKLCQTLCSFGKRKVSTKFPVTEESWWPQFAHINGLLWPPQSFKYTRGVILFANTAQFAINDRQFPQKYHQHIITPPSCSNFTRPSVINSPFSTWSHLQSGLPVSAPQQRQGRHSKEADKGDHQDWAQGGEPHWAERRFDIICLPVYCLCYFLPNNFISFFLHVFM